MLARSLPFWGESELETDLQALNLPVPLERVPEDVRPLLSRLLDKTPQNRPSIAQVLSDPWLQ